MEVTIFGIKLTLNPIAFTIPLGKNHWDIYWYGIIIALGFLLALIYAMKNYKRFNLNSDRMLDVVLVTVPIAILCARAYYVIFDGVKLESISDFFGFGDSAGFAGLAIYGGVIGAFLTGAIMCKIRKVNIFDMFDIASVGFLIGQGIGRWGNFINQEAFGSLTGSSWWGMESPNTIAVVGEGMVHPCFLYESIWCLTGFFILNHFSKKRKFSGQLVLMYGAWYGFGRGFIELLRTDSLMIGNLRISAIVSYVVCIACIVALVYLFRKTNVNSHDNEYTRIFLSDEEANDTMCAETDIAIETTENKETNIIGESENEQIN